MEFLFEDMNELQLDIHLESIINMMLTRLKNKNPKKESKVYKRNVKYVQELYDGTFLHHTFNKGRKDYDYKDCFEKIKAVKGNWTAVRKLILEALNNIDLAKDKNYQPFNKNFVNSISFSTFFEYFDINSDNSGMSSNFLNFINPPKKCYDYTSSITIDKLKQNCLQNILEYGEKIVRKYFRNVSQELSFWYDMEDFSRWLRKFNEVFPNEYSEFILNCKNGNPLMDFDEYLTGCLNYKQGNIIMQPFLYQLSKKGSEKLEGYFLNWLRNGIEKNRFSSLKKLPKSIDNYYKDNSFVKKSVRTKAKEKEVIDFDELIF